MGIAIGVREISLFSAASSVSAGVMRAEAVTMPHAVWATISPPAIFSTGSEMPKKLSTKRPKNMKTTRMPSTYSAVFRAVQLRSRSEKSAVSAKNSGTPPNGFTMGNRARKVAPAAEGRVLRISCTAVPGAISDSPPTLWPPDSGPRPGLRFAAGSVPDHACRWPRSLPE